MSRSRRSSQAYDGVGIRRVSEFEVRVVDSLQRWSSMRQHTVRAVTCSLSAAVAVLMLVVGSSVAVADSHGQGGRSSVSSGRHAGKSANRMGRSVRGARARDSRRAVGRDRGGWRRGWFNRDRRNQDRAFVSIGAGSSRRGYRSSGVFFGFSFTASEYRRSSGLRYRRDVRMDNRGDDRRERSAIEHLSSQSGPLRIPLVASPAAPEVLPLKD